MWFVFFIGILSFVICLIMTPLVIKFSNKFGFVDIPKDRWTIDGYFNVYYNICILHAY